MTKELITKIKEYVEKTHDPDFNFDIEHWDNWNFDDSYEYGVEVGVQYAIQGIILLLQNDQKG